MRFLLPILCFITLQAQGQALFHAHNKASAAPPGPSPTPSMKAWYKASTGLTIDGSGNVTGWNDQSGNGYNLSVGSGYAPALYTATGAGGYAGVGGDGTARQLQCANFMSTSTAATVFIVAKNTVFPPTVEAKTGHVLPRTAVSSSSHFPWTNNTIYENLGTNVRRQTAGPLGGMANVFLYTVTATNGDWRTYTNGAQDMTNSTTSNTYAWGDSLFQLFSAAGWAYYYDGWVLEIIVYDTVLSETDREATRDYLKTKYSIP